MKTKTVFRIEDKDGKFYKTYRHIGHVRQALSYYSRSWRRHVGEDFVVEYEVREINRTPVKEFK